MNNKNVMMALFALFREECETKWRLHASWIINKLNLSLHVNKAKINKPYIYVYYILYVLLIKSKCCFQGKKSEHIYYKRTCCKCRTDSWIWFFYFSISRNLYVCSVQGEDGDIFIKKLRKITIITTTKKI
jgi:hypothetical protein